MRSFCLSFFCSLFVACFMPFFAMAQEEPGILVETKTTKPAYLLGEPVVVSTRITNYTHADADIGFRSHLIKASRNGGDFFLLDSAPRYCGPLRAIKLRPMESFQSAVLGYDWLDPVFSLLMTYEKKVPDPRLVWRYERESAFGQPGSYRVKSVAYTGQLENRKELPALAASFEIEMPKGDDLEVWKRISGERKAKYAQLMVDGHIDEKNYRERDAIAREIKEILRDYPKSVYSPYLKAGIENYKKLLPGQIED